MGCQSKPTGLLVPRPGKTWPERAKPAGRATAQRKRWIIALAMAAPIVLNVHESAAAGNDQGAQLAAMCASCHRLDGRDQGIPTIIGLDEKVLSDKLEAFRSGAQQSQIMHAIAGSLSSEEVAIVAAYLADLKRSEP